MPNPSFFSNRAAHLCFEVRAQPGSSSATNLPNRAKGWRLESLGIHTAKIIQESGIFRTTEPLIDAFETFFCIFGCSLDFSQFLCHAKSIQSLAISISLGLSVPGMWHGAARSPVIWIGAGGTLPVFARLPFRAGSLCQKGGETQGTDGEVGNFVAPAR